MSFNDIRRISYDRLIQRIALDKPYKDSGNAYPLGDRRYSSRHFRHEADESFTIWYADRESIDNKYGKVNDKAKNLSSHRDWYDKRMLGIVRPDNSFEFCSGWCGNGENMLLGQALGAHVYQDKARGGVIYEKGRVAHPVFKGLRINCDTGEAMTEYEAFLPKVKRKEANEVMKQYAEFMSVFETMIKSMDSKGIWEVYVDLYVHEANAREDRWRSMTMPDVKRLIDDRKYIDAGCLFIMLSRFSHMRWRTEWIMNHTDGTGKITTESLPYAFVDKAVADIQVNFRKMILLQHPEVFKMEKIERGAALPASQWGIKVQLDGQPVIRL